MTKTNCDDVAIGFQNDSSAMNFMRYIFVGIFRFDDANNLQSTLSRKIKNKIKTYQKALIATIKRNYFKCSERFFTGSEKIFNSFTNKLFQIKLLYQEGTPPETKVFTKI